MVILKEYRILLPFSLAEYKMGQLYLTARSSRGYSKDGEGIEVLINEPFENHEFGKGQYTKKLFHLSGLIPSWVRYLFPSLNDLVVCEESWNSFPFCKTVFECQYFGDKFYIEVLTMHKDNDLGNEENIHNLSEQDLKMREIDYIDIVNDTVNDKKYKKSEDPSLFESAKTGRGPLKADWKMTTKPIACAYKLVRVKFEAWMFGSRIERAIQDHGFREIFLEVNRQCFCWMDEWIDMTIKDMRNFENQCAIEQQKAVLSPKKNNDKDNQLKPADISEMTISMTNDENKQLNTDSAEMSNNNSKTDNDQSDIQNSKNV